MAPPLSSAAALQVACLACYCQGISDAEKRGALPFDYFNAAVAKAKCKPFLAFDAAGAGINAAIAVLLAAVNVVLGAVIRSLTLFERHRSHTEEHASLCWKTTVAQFLNTSITPLVASAEIRWLSVVFGGIVFESGFPDFTTNWCAHVPCNAPPALPAPVTPPRSLPCQSWPRALCNPRFVPRAASLLGHLQLLRF